MARRRRAACARQGGPIGRSRLVEGRSARRGGVARNPSASWAVLDRGGAMKVLDTDTLTLLLQGHPKVLEQRRQESDEVVIAAVSRSEVLLGRFASLLKAADGAELKRAQ